MGLETLHGWIASSKPLRDNAPAKVFYKPRESSELPLPRIIRLSSGSGCGRAPRPTIMPPWKRRSISQPLPRRDWTESRLTSRRYEKRSRSTSPIPTLMERLLHRWCRPMMTFMSPYYASPLVGTVFDTLCESSEGTESSCV